MKRRMLDILGSNGGSPAPVRSMVGWVAAVCAVAVVLAAGCGSKENRTSLSGKVMYRGKPVTGGVVRASAH